MQHIIFNVHKVPARYLLMNSKRLKTIFFNPQLWDTVVMLLVLLLQYQWQEATKRIWQFRTVYTWMYGSYNETYLINYLAHREVPYGCTRTTCVLHAGDAAWIQCKHFYAGSFKNRKIHISPFYFRVCPGCLRENATGHTYGKTHV